MAVTQKQIAERLNISRETVAHALQGRSDVSAISQRRVLAAAAEMGYDANSNREARMLIGRRYGTSVKTNAVAVIFSMCLLREMRDIPFYMPVLDGIEAEARQHGIEVCYAPVRETEFPRLVREHSVDGAILMTYTPALYDSLRKMEIPAVTLQAHVEGVRSVVSDDREGGRAAVRHLYELGHRRIAYVGARNPWYQVSEEREQGYLDEMQAHGLPVRPEWILSNLPPQTTTATKYCEGCSKCAACIGWSTLIANNGGFWHDGRPSFTAVVCNNDMIAMGVIDKARQDNVNVPDDLSVVGFDDMSVRYHSQPPLTSVAFDLENVGREMMRMLHEALFSKGEASLAPTKHRVVPMKLVLRGSTVKPAIQ